MEFLKKKINFKSFLLICSCITLVLTDVDARLVLGLSLIKITCMEHVMSRVKISVYLVSIPAVNVGLAN